VLIWKIKEIIITVILIFPHLLRGVLFFFYGNSRDPACDFISSYPIDSLFTTCNALLCIQFNRITDKLRNPHKAKTKFYAYLMSHSIF